MNAFVTIGALVALSARAGAPQEPPAPALVRAAACELRFEERPGEALSYVHAVDHVLRVERMETLVEGRPEPSVVSATLEARGGQRVEFVDEFPDRAAGGPRLRRRYADATASVEMRDVRPEAPEGPLSRVEFLSDLAGASVVHVSRADGTWGRYYDAREARESLLALVAPPLDWGALLPPGERRLGDAWSIDPAALALLLAPAGEVGWRPAADEADPQLVRSFRAGLGGGLNLGFDGDVEGRADATLHALGVSDGVKVATIRVAFELELVADQTEMLRRQALDPERTLGVAVLEAGSRRRLVGRVDLVWDVDGRRPRFATGSATERLELTVRAESTGEGVAATQTLLLEGPASFELTATPATPAPPPAPPR